MSLYQVRKYGKYIMRSHKYNNSNNKIFEDINRAVKPKFVTFKHAPLLPSVQFFSTHTVGDILYQKLYVSDHFNKFYKLALQ